MDDTVQAHVVDLRQEGLSKLSEKLDEGYDKFVKELAINFDRTQGVMRDTAGNLEGTIDSATDALLKVLTGYSTNLSTEMATGFSELGLTEEDLTAKDLKTTKEIEDKKASVLNQYQSDNLTAIKEFYTDQIERQDKIAKFMEQFLVDEKDRDEEAQSDLEIVRSASELIQKDVDTVRKTFVDGNPIPASIDYLVTSLTGDSPSSITGAINEYLNADSPLSQAVETAADQLVDLNTKAANILSETYNARLAIEAGNEIELQYNLSDVMKGITGETKANLPNGQKAETTANGQSTWNNISGTYKVNSVNGSNASIEDISSGAKSTISSETLRNLGVSASAGTLFTIDKGANMASVVNGVEQTHSGIFGKKVNTSTGNERWAYKSGSFSISQVGVVDGQTKAKVVDANGKYIDTIAESVLKALGINDVHAGTTFDINSNATSASKVNGFGLMSNTWNRGNGQFQIVGVGNQTANSGGISVKNLSTGEVMDMYADELKYYGLSDSDIRTVGTGFSISNGQTKSTPYVSPWAYGDGLFTITSRKTVAGDGIYIGFKRMGIDQKANVLPLDTLLKYGIPASSLETGRTFAMNGSSKKTADQIEQADTSKESSITWPYGSGKFEVIKKTKKGTLTVIEFKTPDGQTKTVKFDRMLEYGIPGELLYGGKSFTINSLGQWAGYAKGTTHAKKGLAEVFEEGPEIITTSKGTFIPFKGGEGVVPADQTKALMNFADMIQNGNIELQMPDMSGYQPLRVANTVTNNNDVHFDSLITINGNADQQTVNEIQQIAKQLISNKQFRENVTQFVSKMQAADGKMSGKRVGIK